MNFFKKRKDIYRNDNEVYLMRWNLFECKYFSIKIHKILKSDDDCLHDHPWAFISIILKGGYVEYREIEITHFYNEFSKGGGYADGVKSTREETVNISKIYHAFNILYRKATDKHKLEIHQPCTTLVITFKKTREWGFWTKNGFIKWFDYSHKEHCE